MTTAQNDERYYRKQHHNKRAFISLGLMCLSAGLFNAFLNSKSELIDYPFHYLATIVAWPYPWSVGLRRWIHHLKNVSDAACNNSLIGGLIAANLGLLYTASDWRQSCYLERNLQYILWPTHIGTLIGYCWEWSKWFQVKVDIGRHLRLLRNKISWNRSWHVGSHYLKCEPVLIPMVQHHCLDSYLESSSTRQDSSNCILAVTWSFNVACV